jgi:hypothetical protein
MNAEITWLEQFEAVAKTPLVRSGLAGEMVLELWPLLAMAPDLAVCYSFEGSGDSPSHGIPELDSPLSD